MGAQPRLAPRPATATRRVRTCHGTTGVERHDQDNPSRDRDFALILLSARLPHGRLLGTPRWATIAHRTTGPRSRSRAARPCARNRACRPVGVALALFIEMVLLSLQRRRRIGGNNL